jgi:hypothetical protein
MSHLHGIIHIVRVNLHGHREGELVEPQRTTAHEHFEQIHHDQCGHFLHQSSNIQKRVSIVSPSSNFVKRRNNMNENQNYGMTKNLAKRHSGNTDTKRSVHKETTTKTVFFFFFLDLLTTSKSLLRA